MVLMYRGFEGSKVFKWARGHSDRVTVMFPAEPFFNRCVDRVLQEYRAGKSVLAWGDPVGLARVQHALKEHNVPVVPFAEKQRRQRPAVNKRLELSLNLL